MSVRKSTRYLLASLVAASVAPAALAASPYDTPYGLQWSYQAGTSGDNLARDIAVTSDGTVFIMDRASGTATFGSGAVNSVNGNIGAIDANGNFIFGTTISSLPGMSAGNQNYAAGVNAAGGKAYFAIYNNNANSFWTGLEDPNNPGSFIDEDGKQSNSPMVWSVDSAALQSSGINGAIGDRRSISIYADDSGTLRTDPFAPSTTGMTSPNGQYRMGDSALRASSLDMIMVGDMVTADFGTAGDYGGAGQRNANGDDAYFPGIGRYNFNTNTLDGPAHQPTLFDSVQASDWLNMGVYVNAEIDQNSGWYYGGGLSHSRGDSSSTGWDPDGAGPESAVNFTNSFSISQSAGIGTAYDANNDYQYAVTWDTPGFDYIYAIGAVNDGSNSAIWGGEKNNNAYFAKYDASGNMVWEEELAFTGLSDGSTAERVSEIEVQDDGTIWVQGYFTNADGALDSFVSKRASDGSEIWTKVVAGGAADSGLSYNDVAEDADFDDEAIYSLVRTDGSWLNTTGHTNLGGDDILIQKLVPGDFSSDGFTDYDDVEMASTAIAGAGGSLGAVDTYDFNRDGNSDAADGMYFVTNILDRRLGDIENNDMHQNPVSEVDNGDLGVATANFTGSAGSGKTYSTGDIDFDGDVDNRDLGKLIGNFGTSTPADNGKRAYLLYDSATGEVTLDAFFAGGGVITSFVLEDDGAGLNSANYTGPGFGGGYEEASSNVIGDTDDSLAGATDRTSLGEILAAGLSIGDVEAQLETALYTGEEGTGQFELDFFDFFIRGDMNGDGALTNGDIAPFVQALTDPASYAGAFPAIDPDIVGDFTGEQGFTNGDIAGFVAALTGGSPGVVPEPSTALLLGILGGMGVLRRRR